MPGVCLDWDLVYGILFQMNCAIFNRPEARDDPTLWRTTPEGEEEFLWNSSRAESNNSWLEGNATPWLHFYDSASAPLPLSCLDWAREPLCRLVRFGAWRSGGDGGLTWNVHGQTQYLSVPSLYRMVCSLVETCHVCVGVCQHH